MNCIVVFDIDGVIRDVGSSYRRAIADTVEYFTDGAYRPTMEDIDLLKSEGIWNNDWEASRESIYRYYESLGRSRRHCAIDYDKLVTFFQSRYRGTEPENWNGYICTEPLLIGTKYLEELSANGISWGFFSGATRGSAEYVLKRRLGIKNPILIAMEDAPSKPDPTGLLATVNLLEHSIEGKSFLQPAIYLGDTVADMYAIVKARAVQPERRWIGVGILPPHVHSHPERRDAYSAMLRNAGADGVYNNVEDLSVARIQQLIERHCQI